MDSSPVGPLEVQQHEDVEQFGAGSGTERVQGARVAGARAHRDARSEATPSHRRLSACRGQRLVNENGRESADSLSCTNCPAASRSARRPGQTPISVGRFDPPRTPCREPLIRRFVGSSPTPEAPTARRTGSSERSYRDAAEGSSGQAPSVPSITRSHDAIGSPERALSTTALTAVTSTPGSSFMTK
jgi:hypothetical protein